MYQQISRINVVLPIPSSVPALLQLGNTVVSAMTNNTHFPSPVPKLGDLSALGLALGEAQARTDQRTKGASELRDSAKVALVSGLRCLQAHVQQVADTAPKDAPAIIASAGMSTRKVSSRKKPPFEVKQGLVSGQVHLVARALGRKATYYWQHSTDDVTWTNVPATLVAKATVSGLNAATMYHFRFRPLSKAGEGEWQTLTFTVK
jgi:hypothetical protein